LIPVQLNCFLKQHGSWPAQPAFGAEAARELFSLAADQADLGQVEAPVSCPAAPAVRHYPGWGAAADSDGPAVESLAAGVVAAAVEDAAADWGAPPAAWVAAVAAAVDVGAAAGASSNRGAHTKGGPRNSVPNSRRD
jgi:hypothetical protein